MARNTNSAPLSIFLPFLLAFFAFLPTAFPYAETGSWDLNFKLRGDAWKPFAKSMFNNTSVYLEVNVDCNASASASAAVQIDWVLRRTGCAEEYIQLLRAPESTQTNLCRQFLKNPDSIMQRTNLEGKSTFCRVGYIHGTPTVVKCGKKATIEVQTAIVEKTYCGQKQPPVETASVQVKTPVNTPVARDSNIEIDAASENVAAAARRRREAPAPPMPKDADEKGKKEESHLVARSWEDGVYLLVVGLEPLEPLESAVLNNVTFDVGMKVRMKADYGYLSAGDYPKRPFYLVMCLLYVVYGVAWLIVLARQWRDLLQIQFWIGGVIILGTLEKAVFYTEYQTINNTGVSMPGAVLFAEIVSCAKRTLARMLVIIVSLGFGIVKPRLGPLLHRILLLGGVYFVLGSVEAGLRNYKHSGDQSQQLLLAQIPLAVIDAGICWWVFSSLVQTMRTLRLRRNTTKLSLFRHLTNVIIFSVIASVIFMIWSIRSHRVVDCLTDWKELWVDDAFWHALFSILLAVIMVLWRPTANNQRYAFSALLDDAEDADPEEEPMMTEAYEGMKMRSHVGDGGSKETSATPNKTADEKFEDDLKWVEENIPTSVADTALPSLLDSDEEIMTTKFEMSKME